jgi:hypothetical protein
MLLIVSVLAVWVEEMKTILRTSEREAASIISRVYGTRDVCQRPGRAERSGLKYR